MLDETLRVRAEKIIDEMKGFGRMTVAFSGGVDSSVVAALAYKALGAEALAVTAVSETLAARELDDARAIAAEIGIPHQTIEFSELSDDDFVANTSARCFYCQTMRFGQLKAMASSIGHGVVASGSNQSDLGDHRPGLAAMENQEVYQPLLAHEIDKSEVRSLAKWLGLSVWDKPAKACLSSRIPYGLEVTRERLRRIELAEDVLDDLGFRQYRVRDHGGIARVEISTDEMAEALDKKLLVELAARVKGAGFERVLLDMIGYRSGSLNPAAE